MRSPLSHGVSDSFEWATDPRVRTVRRLLFGALLGVVPLLLLRARLFEPGYPYLHDFVSNLYPILHVRWSLAHGQLPIYTSLWYGGEYQFMNPLWKALYPPVWPLLVPRVPLLPGMKALFAAHYLAATVVAYWYAEREFAWWVAAPFALLFVTPMALFMGLTEKVLGWPWFVLVVWQLTPPRLGSSSRWPGVLAGVGLGALLLAGSVYHFFYGCLLVGTLVVAARAGSFAANAALGSLVGLPKVLVSIVPTMLFQVSRPESGHVATVANLVSGVAGFWVRPQTLRVVTEYGRHGPIHPGGYRPVGLPAALIALAVVLWVLVDPPRRDRAWLYGVLTVGVLGVLLAVRWEPLYALPPFDLFRMTIRAVVLVSVAVLLLVWYALAQVRTRRPSVPPAAYAVGRGVLTGLVVLSVVSTLGAWALVERGHAANPTVDDRLAADVASSPCDRVWLEGTATSPSGAVVRLPYQKPIGYQLTRRGVPLTAVNYGRIGQEYSAHRGGELTFEVLIVGTPLPNAERYRLTGGWGRPVRGVVDTDRFDRYRVYRTDEGPVYVYATETCSDS